MEEYVYINDDDFDDIDDTTYNDTIIYTNKNHNILKKLTKLSNANYMYFFDFKKYIIDIWKSYKSPVDIYNQFNVDFDRQDIYVGKFKCKTVAEFDAYMTYINNNAIKNIVYVLCNQSSFALPYEILCKMYANNNNIVVSTSNDMKNVDRTTVNINILKTQIILVLKTSLFVVDHMEYNAMYKISLEVNINIPQIKRKCEDKTTSFLIWSMTKL